MGYQKWDERRGNHMKTQIEKQRTTEFLHFHKRV